MTLHRFIDELKRRHVFRVAGVYLVVAWGAIEAVTGVSELLTDSDTPGKVVAWLAIAGFPLALVLSWFYDITRQGIIRTAATAEAVADAGARPLPVLSARATGMFGLGMLVALLSFAGYSLFNGHRGPSGDVAAVRALAVLPLEGRGDAALPDAITEELIRRLSREDSLEVTARTSAFRFKGTTEPLTEVARQLGVQALLAGSVRREGESYVIGVELIDAGSGRVLWSPASYRVSEREAWRVYERIADDLLAALQVSGSRLAAPPTTSNEQAARLYALGLERLRARTDRDLRAALDYFQRAAAADPEFAAASAALAQTYAVLPSAGEFSPVEAFTKGMSAASVAVSIDPTSSEAHAAVGQLVQNYDWQPSASLRSYERAIEFNRSNAVAHQWYAEALLLLGRLDEAESAVAEAIKLDPLSPAAMQTQAYVQLVQGDYERALATLLNAVSLFPEFRPASMSLALVAALTGRHAEMARALQAFAGSNPALSRQLQAVAAGVQDPAARASAARTLASLEPALGSVAALWYAALGDADAALGVVERTWESHADPNFPFVLVHPLLQSLHSRPAFQAIIADVGVQLPAL